KPCKPLVNHNDILSIEKQRQAKFWSAVTGAPAIQKTHPSYSTLEAMTFIRTTPDQLEAALCRQPYSSILPATMRTRRLTTGLREPHAWDTACLSIGRATMSISAARGPKVPRSSVRHSCWMNPVTTSIERRNMRKAQPRGALRFISITTATTLTTRAYFPKPLACLAVQDGY